MGADGSWFLTEADYNYAVAHPNSFLFNLTYNRNIGGAPPTFDSTQFFEINMPSLLSGTYLQWNVYGWWNPVDMYFVQTTAQGNTLFSFQLVDSFNYFYAIISQFSNECVAATGGGHLNIQTCQMTNTAQLFQFINPAGPSPVQSQTMVPVSLQTAYYLPNYFMAYNVHDNAVLGKQISASSSNWNFQEWTSLADAALNPVFFFNLSFNRAVSAAPSFTSESLFEILCPATAPYNYLEWNVYGFGTTVAFYWVPAQNQLQENLMWTFTLVDPVNYLYQIKPNLVEGADDCISAQYNSSFSIMACDRLNTTQLFQFLNPRNVLQPITTTTTTTTTSPVSSSFVEISCFANASFTAPANWQASVQGSIVAGVTTVLSPASSALTVITVTAFNVQLGTQSNGQQGATVRLVLQTTAAQQNFLVQQGGVSSLRTVLLSSGVGLLSSVQAVSTPNGDIPSGTTNTATSSSSGFFSEGWQVGVFVIVLLVALLIFAAAAFCAWRYHKRNQRLDAAVAKLPEPEAEKQPATLAPEGRKNSASLQLGQMHAFAGKSDDTPIETADTADAETLSASTRLTNAHDDSAGPDV